MMSTMKRSIRLNRKQTQERRAAILADAPKMSYKELMKKYRLKYGTVALLLRRSKVKIGKMAPRGRRGMPPETRAAILAAAPNSTRRELMKRYKLTYNQVSTILSKGGVRIGLRENMRCSISPDHKNAWKQLKIVAALRAAKGQQNYSEIGLQFQVSRELVSQIAFKARELGLLNLANPALLSAS